MQANGGMTPLSLLAAAAIVARRLSTGFVPWIGPEGDQSWARYRRGHIDYEGPITPPQGVVLDELAFQGENESTGVLHSHRLFGRLRQHRHKDGTQSHAHMVGGPSVQPEETIDP
jgi:hypothetical protein